VRECESSGGLVKDKFSRVSEIDWARLAAYIDGEGGIRIDVQNPSKGNSFHSRHILEVRVYNCDPRLVLWCKRTFFGGNVKPVRSKVRNPKHKQEHVWYAASAAAERILLGCLPYFIIKHQHAQVALAFRRLIGKVGQRVALKNLEQREKLRQDLALLNKKGVATELVQ
jgi:hypothetical protein